MFVNSVHKINKSYRKNVRYSKCIINNVNESIKLHRQIKADIMNQDGLEYFVIPQDAALKYAQTQNVSIFEYQGDWDKEPGLAKSVSSIKVLAEAL